MASQKRDRYLKKKKNKLKKKSLLSPLFSSIDENGFLVSNRPFHGPKLSELILDLAKPKFDTLNSPQSIESACSLAIIAWNVAVRSESQPDVPFSMDIDPQDIDFIYSVILEKKRRFPSDKRFISDFFFDDETNALVIHAIILN